jgi:hypothetical protein
MKIDIRRYLSLRDSLLKEKNILEVRLQEINQALGQSSSAALEATATAPSGPRGRRRGRRGGGISLRDAVMQVATTPLTKEEILQKVEGLGYRFSTKNPLNSLGVILYGKNPKFRNDGGRFSLPGGRASAAAPQPAKAGRAPGRQRRTLSPEARARIAAAQRARWAKARGGK